MIDRSTFFALAAATPLVLGGLTATATPAAAAPGDLDPLTPVDNTQYRGGAKDASVFFQTPDGRNCAIFWNNGPVGCDAAPTDAPPETNQLRTSVTEAAHFRNSPEPTFTLPEGATVLPEGHKITLANATCGMGYQGAVTCEVGDHGFTLAATYSELH